MPSITLGSLNEKKGDRERIKFSECAFCRKLHTFANTNTFACLPAEI